MNLKVFAILIAAAAYAQEPLPTVTLDPAGDAREQAELNQAVNDAGSSSIDLIRVLERHLKKYPESKQLVAIEKALAKAAMDTNDNARIVVYGEKVLARQKPPDALGDIPTLLDRLTRALVDKKDPELAKKAIVYSRRYQQDAAAARSVADPPQHMTPGQWSDEVDRALARALALEARATGYTGDSEGAVTLARKSWETFPTGEGSRELAYWLSILGRANEAIEFYADAFTLEDPRNTEMDRVRDRARLGELYTKLNGSEKGLGDAILQAYDRTSGLLEARRASLRAKDPNALATAISDFTLLPVDRSAPPLPISSLKGKTVVMDFWATWCAPCRAQQPLIENVKKHFEGRNDVLFIAVDADDDLSLVEPFAKEQGWRDFGYFEAGLARYLVVGNIPTVVVLGPDGRISSRLIGFVPDRFEQLLTERVEEARLTAK